MSFEFNGQSLEKGTRTYHKLDIASMLDGNTLHVVAHVIRGENYGPS